ncbi:hypothetical protein [Amnibacterium setariae]|uniref:hypothetical protein n=1 Tax=Amnibacterium setariae TaxID=2306585 RepID=UPI001F483EEB|nr:hypothetical protein [Amnibacterium setariae]
MLVALGLLELVTLAALLANLVTVHDLVVARILGPVHGAVYLVVALVALLAPGLRWPVRLLGLLPVVGGAAVAWRVRRAEPAEGDAG